MSKMHHQTAKCTMKMHHQVQKRTKKAVKRTKKMHHQAKKRTNRQRHIQPLIDMGYLEPTIQGNPKAKGQKYRKTSKKI